MTDHDPIEIHDADALAAGAVGEPGSREFYIQARTESASLTVLVEKEQVALLAAEAVAFLDRVESELAADTAGGLEPSGPGDDIDAAGTASLGAAIDAPIPAAALARAALIEPTVPLFRARLIGLGFDPARQLVLIELRERATDDEEDEDGGAAVGDATADETAAALAAALADPAEPDPGDEEGSGFVARIFATPVQVRAMALRGAEAVAAGRPPCRLCNAPMDPAGHRCPRWN